MTAQRPYIFLSHSRLNLPLRDGCIQRLTDAGFTLWYDERDIEPGARWTRAIEGAIKNCAAVVLIYSKEAAESRWIERETLYADELQKPIFVVRTDDTPIPFSMKELQAVELGADGSGYDRLIKTLNKLAAFKNPEKVIERRKKEYRDHRFFKHLRTLPDGDRCAEVALKLLEWAEPRVDEISFSGNKEPSLAAVLWIGSGGLSVFRIRAYPKQPSVELSFSDLAAFPPYTDVQERLDLLARLNALMPAAEQFDAERIDRRPNIPLARVLGVAEHRAVFEQILESMVETLRAGDGGSSEG